MSLGAGTYTRPGGSSAPTTGPSSTDSKTKRRSCNGVAQSNDDEETERSGAKIVGINFRTVAPRAHVWPAAIGPTPSRLLGGRVSSAGPGATVGALDTGVSRPVCCGPLGSRHEGREDQCLQEGPPRQEGPDLMTANLSPRGPLERDITSALHRASPRNRPWRRKTRHVRVTHVKACPLTEARQRRR